MISIIISPIKPMGMSLELFLRSIIQYYVKDYINQDQDDVQYDYNVYVLAVHDVVQSSVQRNDT